MVSGAFLLGIRLSQELRNEVSFNDINQVVSLIILSQSPLLLPGISCPPPALRFFLGQIFPRKVNLIS